MCACGCLLLLVLAGGIAWAALHGLWVVAVLVLVATAAGGWFGRNVFTRPKSTKP